MGTEDWARVRWGWGSGLKVLGPSGLPEADTWGETGMVLWLLRGGQYLSQ